MRPQPRRHDTEAASEPWPAPEPRHPAAAAPPRGAQAQAAAPPQIAEPQPAQAPPAQPRPVHAQPALRRLLLGRTAAGLATSLIPTTLTLAVVHGTGSASALGLVLAAELVPMLLLLPVAGVFADRFPARRIVLGADLTRAAAQAATGAVLLTAGARIPALAALAALTGAAVAFGTPAVRTLVSAAVTGPDRLRLNARMSVWQGLAQFAGPAVAGTLTLAVGTGWASLLTAALFVGSAFTLGAVRTPVRTPPQTDTDSTADTDTDPAGAGTASASGSFLADLRTGWAQTRRHPWFIANVLGHGVWHLSAGFLLTLGPVIAIAHLGGGTAWVVILQSGTVGMLAGVWAAGRLPIRRPLVAVALGASAFTLPLTALAVTAPLPVVLAAYFAAMFGLGVLDPLWETTLQRRIPADALGRVGSFDALISFATRPLGLALAAPWPPPSAPPRRWPWARCWSAPRTWPCSPCPPSANPRPPQPSTPQSTTTPLPPPPPLASPPPPLAAPPPPALPPNAPEPAAPKGDRPRPNPFPLSR
ncbi:MFS transporter [Catenulispora yoronensis]